MIGLPGVAPALPVLLVLGWLALAPAVQSAEGLAASQSDAPPANDTWQHG